MSDQRTSDVTGAPGPGPGDGSDDPDGLGGPAGESGGAPSEAAGSPAEAAGSSGEVVGPAGESGGSPAEAAGSSGEGDAGDGTGRAAGGTAPSSAADTVPRSARLFVAVVLLALAVPGVIGFELWPMSGWRLFSLSRGESQTQWVVEAVDGAGASRPVDLEELPLGYRHAAWPMSELPGASTERREDVCQALLGAVVEVEPAAAALNITRDRQRLVERGGDWTLTHDPELIHTCTVGAGGEAGE